MLAVTDEVLLPCLLVLFVCAGGVAFDDAFFSLRSGTSFTFASVIPKNKVNDLIIVECCHHR